MSRVIERRERIIGQPVVVSLLCDRCGKECLPKPERLYEREGAGFEGSFSYGSRFDNEGWKFDLCDDCCEWLRSQLREGVDVNAF